MSKSVEPPAASASREPVAIVGIGCRFPRAHGVQAFWRLLCDGVDAITEMPRDRFDVDRLVDSRPGVPGKLYAPYGGFLDGVEAFDPYFFGISPREAERMDPQQRVLLETVWEAVEDAGQLPERLADSLTGVFVASCYHDYDHVQLKAPELLDVYASTGGAQGVLAGRISYALNLRGPSLSVDSACSSSMVALHLACQSLHAGESELAIAAAVNVMLAPEVGFGFARAGMLSPEGRCKFGDASANGFVRSEGVAALLLKPLRIAQRDGDRVYALIAGTAINNQGRSSGLLMTPGRTGQEDVLRAAYQDAGISPQRVQYVEAHGTGTSVGDPVELAALGAVIGAGRTGDARCPVGSVKTNIGHTEGAAGMAGVIKTALALKHGLLPPSLHFKNPNPAVPWNDLGLVVQQELGPWPAGAEPRIAGVSAFGINGTNGHVVLQEPPIAPPAVDEARSAPPARAHLLTLSARSAAALQRVARRHAEWLGQDGEQPGLDDLCYTASCRRSHHEHRLSVVAETRRELVEQIEDFLGGESRAGVSAGVAEPGAKPKVAFVFPGQGSQWIGMGRALYAQESAFKHVIDECERHFRAHVEWSLLAELAADSTTSQLHRVDVIQPAIFAIQVGIAAVLAQWGIVPDVVVGHSLGEVAAAVVAGALSLKDGARVICERSLLVRSTCGRGAMMVAELSHDEAVQALADHGDRASVAATNGPRSIILSGEPAALTAIGERLTAKDVHWRWIKVDYASHSSQMDPLSPQLLRSLASLQPQTPRIPLASTVGRPTNDVPAFDAAYWARNLRERVSFWERIQELVTDGHEIFVEISPHPVLASTLQEGLRTLRESARSIPTLWREKNERSCLLATAGQLHVLGCTLDWRGLHPAGGDCVALPSYPFEREVFPVHAPGAEHGASRGIVEGEHPLLGPHVVSATHAGTHLWQTTLGGHAPAYLAGHRVGGAVVLPAAAYLEMARASAEQAFGSSSCEVERFVFSKPLVLPEQAPRSVELVLSPSVYGKVAVRIFSRGGERDEGAGAWILHASGELRVGAAQSNGVASAAPVSIAEAQARCARLLEASECYAALAQRDLSYGPSFQGIAQLWLGDGEALGRLALPTAAGGGSPSYGVHPVLLDSAFQLLETALPKLAEGEQDDPYLPVSLDSFRVHRQAGVAAWGHARIREGTDDGAIVGDVSLLDDEGNLLAEARGLRCVRAGDGQQRDLDSLHAIEWREAAEPPPAAYRGPRGPWLVFADHAGLGQELIADLRSRGERVLVVRRGDRFASSGRDAFVVDPKSPADYERLFATIASAGTLPVRAVVHMWSLDAPAPTTLESIELATDLGCVTALHLVQALAGLDDAKIPRLWLVTRGAQSTGVEGSVAVGQAALLGLARTIAHEHPELSCVRIDLDPDVAGANGHPAQALARELLDDTSGDERALRGGKRLVARIGGWARPAAANGEASLQPVGDAFFRLERPASGVIADLKARRCSEPRVGPGEVAIEVRGAGINFADVLSTMGIYPGQRPETSPFGLECAGVVTAVGSGVDHVRVGDAVVAIALPPRSCFGSHVVTDGRFVCAKPSKLDFDAAAGLPIALLTTYVGLYELARLAPGERVLVHSASGGVGLAAIELARSRGAIVLATAGTPEKREFLRSLGVEHVMDSRSLQFAEETLAKTGGKGVDVVLNSLAGEAITKSLEVLAPYGRFVEIGKRDIYDNSQIGLWPFRKNLSFFAVDIHSFMAERPDSAGRCIRESMALVEAGEVRPAPTRVIPVAQAAEAFDVLREAKHIGKVVIGMSREELNVAPAAAEPAAPFRSDATYLVTGGLGGLGLVMARWMLDRGARHVVLAGRSAPPAETVAAIRAMADAVGADVRAVQADVADPAAVRRVLDEIDARTPPLRGVIHCAGLLDDGVVAQLDASRMRTVAAPKIRGAWNLHRMTADRELDCFILFSSAASLLGSPGQANYAAANAFLDALAHHRRRAGLPALSVAWGPWSHVGLAAAQANRGERLGDRGIASITPQDGVRLLEHVIAGDVAHVGVFPIDARRWAQFNPAAGRSTYLSGLAQSAREDARTSDAGASGDRVAVKTLRELPAGPARRAFLQDLMLNHVAQVLRLRRERVDPDKALGSLGLDSLMAVELRNRLDTSLGVRLPIATIWNYPTVNGLVPQLAARMQIELEPSVGDGQDESDDEDVADLAALLEAAHADESSDVPVVAATAASSDGEGQ